MLSLIEEDLSPGPVYVVDDDSSVRESLGRYVRSVGWPVETFGSAQEFVDSRSTSQPSCLVLDLQLPDLNGLELQGQLDPKFSIIYLTGHGDIPTSVRAMEAGALEFLTKPPPVDRLLAAIRDAFARTQSWREVPTPNPTLAPQQPGARESILLSFPPFQLDLKEQRLWKAGVELPLRRKPFAVLRYLAEHPQQLVMHEELIEAVWGKVVMSDSVLRSHIRVLRQVLGEGLVETVIGRGYRFLVDVRKTSASPQACVTMPQAPMADALPASLRVQRQRLRIEPKVRSERIAVGRDSEAT